MAWERIAMTHRFEIVADYGWGGTLLFMIPFIKKWYLGRITETFVETQNGDRYLWTDLLGVHSAVTSHGTPVAVALDFGSRRVQINLNALRNGPQIWVAIEQITRKV